MSKNHATLNITSSNIDGMMILNLASLRRKTRKYKSSNDLHVNPNAIIIMENMDIDLKSIHLEMYLLGH